LLTKINATREFARGFKPPKVLARKADADPLEIFVAQQPSLRCGVFDHCFLVGRGANVTSARLIWSKPLNEKMSPHAELSFFRFIALYGFLDLIVEVFVTAHTGADCGTNKFGKFTLDSTASLALPLFVGACDARVGFRSGKTST
jgi:hypothetical protein